MNLPLILSQSHEKATSQIEIVTPSGLQPVSPRVSSETEAVGEAIFDQDLPEWVLADFRASGVPDRLMRTNIRYFEGRWALEILTEHAIAALGGVSAQTSGYITKPAQRILEKYAFIQDGAWAARGCTLDGSPAAIWQLKPLHPRKGTSKGFGKAPKPIKYETPQGAIGLPILPFVDSETAAKCCARWGIEQREGETFWQMIRRCNVPIVLTEGIKKALSLLTQGIPAIASRSITQWAKKGTQEPHEAIAQFCQPGRRFYIAFDRDEKLKTQIAVGIQARRLGEAIAALGAQPLYLIWDRELGKGIDDVLAGQGENARAWLDQAIADALQLQTYKKSGYLPGIERANRLDAPLLRHTEGGYMPPLPPLEQGTIYAVSAGTGSGKTSALPGAIQSARKRGKLTLVLSPVNALGQQTAEKLDFPHIRDYQNEDDPIQDRMLKDALWLRVRDAGGLVMCPHSLHHLPEWFVEKLGLIVLDEANQILFDTLSGETLGDRLDDIAARLDRVLEAAGRQGSILAMEANLTNRTIDYLKGASRCSRVQLITHKRESMRWDVQLMSDRRPEGFRGMLLDELESKKILLVSTSQREGRRMERAARLQYPDKKIVRIDGQTNRKGVFSRFFGAPDPWIEAEQPDLLILSPSAKSGVSITIAHFDRVYGFLNCLGTDTHMQILDRYRLPVPRVIYCPEIIMSSGDEGMVSARRITQHWYSLANGLAHRAGLTAALTDQTAEARERQERILNLIAEGLQVLGMQKSIAAQSLQHSLEQAGHTVRVMESPENPEIKDLWKRLQSEIDWEDAGKLAEASIGDRHTKEWAISKGNSGSLSEEDEIRIRKIFLRDAFPGMGWDDRADCYRAIFEHHGALRRGVLLQAAAENHEGAEAHDVEALRRILEKGFKALHRLPKMSAKALLLKEIGILNLLEGAPTYSNDDPRCQLIKEKALHFAPAIAAIFRLQVRAEHTPVEIANKLLRKLHLKGKVCAWRGGRGEQQKLWSIEGADDLLRIRMLEARRRKLSETVLSICNKHSDPSYTNQEYAPETSPPPWLEGVPLAEHPELLQMMREARESGPEAIEAIEAIAASMRWEVA